MISSVGRASALQAECRRFDSVITHQVFPFIVIENSDCAVVAQLVRVSACHAEGRGFEPRPPRQIQFRVISSVGRASALQAECRRFDSVITHQVSPFIVVENNDCAVVAQLVRVSACHAEGRGFEPRPPRQK